MAEKLLKKPRTDSHLDTVRESFEKQAEDFSRSPVMTDAEALDRLAAWTGLSGTELVLDVACGPGLVAVALAAGARHVVGIDVTPAMIARACEVVAERGAANVTFALGDGTQLPVSDGAFDRVVCRRSFHHFPDPGAVLAEMSRVCVPGGMVVIEDQAALPDHQAAETMRTIDLLRDPSHARAVDPGAWEPLFERCGLVRDRIALHPRDLDFDEWMNRAHPDPADASRARELLEAAARGEIPGPRAWQSGGALLFRIEFQIVRAVKA